MFLPHVKWKWDLLELTMKCQKRGKHTDVVEVMVSPLFRPSLCFCSRQRSGMKLGTETPSQHTLLKLLFPFSLAQCWQSGISQWKKHLYWLFDYSFLMHPSQPPSLYHSYVSHWHELQFLPFLLSDGWTPEVPKAEDAIAVLTTFYGSSRALQE